MLCFHLQMNFEYLIRLKIFRAQISMKWLSCLTCRIYITSRKLLNWFLEFVILPFVLYTSRLFLARGREHSCQGLNIPGPEERRVWPAGKGARQMRRMSSSFLHHFKNLPLASFPSERLLRPPTHVVPLPRTPSPPSITLMRKVTPARPPNTWL